ncbi:hypothetical protein EU522_01480 [Candidatus Thorarchaeota archaeon]|nr:MAG: hypothetical protein EU522_01480 [Candidatus Thorarchaeota archaeon]
MSAKSTHEVTVFSSGHEVYEEYRYEAEPTFDSLASSFLTLADARMSSTQKLVMLMSARLLRHHDLTVTALADLISRRSSVPYSTVKWNLRALMELGLLHGGTTSNKGELARCSDTGLMLAQFLDSNND